jgi:thioredoxin-related protein
MISANSYGILLILLFLNINLFAQDISHFIPEPFPIPLDSVDQLSYLIPLVNDSITLDSQLIIIYGFTGCKPCEVLKRRVQKKLDGGVITSSSIVYVNIFVLDTLAFRNKLLKSSITFPYYATESPYTKEVTGAFPMITAYNNGLKKWSLYGYSPLNNRQMLQYIER